MVTKEKVYMLKLDIWQILVLEMALEQMHPENATDHFWVSKQRLLEKIQMEAVK